MEYDVNHEYKKLVNLLQETNTPFFNLYNRNYLPASVQEQYSLLVNKMGIDPLRLWTSLQRDVLLDSKRMQKYYLWDFAVEQRDDLVPDTYPELASLEVDGLLPLTFPVEINKNGFLYKNSFLVFPNIFSHNYHFTHWLINNWKGQFKLALPYDFNRLGLPRTKRTIILESFWYGPRSLNKVKASLNGAERVVYGGLPLGLEVNDITDFHFNKRKGQWHFEIEELLPLPFGFDYSTDVQFRGRTLHFYTRYIHAITDAELLHCTHIDGALIDYKNNENFLKRHRYIEKSSPKSYSTRHKLFRIDQKSGLRNFQELIGLFFNNNPYIYEFFEGANEQTKELERLRNKIFELNIEKLKSVTTQS